MAVIYAYEDAQIVGTTPVLVYTCPANTAAIVSSATMANVGSVAHLVTAYVVRSGESTTNDQIKEINTPVNADADEYLDKLIGKHLSPNDAIWVKLDAAGTVNVTIDIREVV